MKKTIAIIIVCLLVAGAIGTGIFIVLDVMEEKAPEVDVTEDVDEDVDEDEDEDEDEEIAEDEDVDVDEDEEILSYENTKYGFRFDYPNAWYMIEGGADAEIIRLSSTGEASGDGGTPLGANIDIYVIENYENLSLEDWLAELMEYGLELDILEKDTFEAGNVSFLRQTYAPFPDLPGVVAGPVVAAHALIKNGAYVLQINYLGREPCYSEGINHYESLLRGFEVTN